MICSRCGKEPAQTYVKRNGDGEVRLVLCPDCYKALYPNREDDFVTSFIGSVGEKPKACPACGTTLEDYRATGLLGCAYCYTAFRAELTPVIRYIQGKIKHEGKRPSGTASENYDTTRMLLDRRDALKERIEQALRGGDYASAERLKEELRAVTLRMKGEKRS